jgi:hypothetical protein
MKQPEETVAVLFTVELVLKLDDIEALLREEFPLK